MQFEQDLKEKLEELIRNNQVKYYKIAISYTKNKEDSLDALQNAIVKSLQNYHKIGKPQYMDSWFCRILINECFNILKSKGKENLTDMEDYYREEVTSTDQDFNTYLYQAINNLNDKLKKIIILRFFNDMKIEEIADIMNTNLSTTKSRLYKALDILKKEMEVSLYEK